MIQRRRTTTALIAAACALALLAPTAATSAPSAPSAPTGSNDTATSERRVEEATTVTRLDPENDPCDGGGCTRHEFPRPRVKAVDLRKVTFRTLQDTQRVVGVAKVRDLTDLRSEGQIKVAMNFSYVPPGERFQEGASVHGVVGSRAVTKYDTTDFVFRPCPGGLFTWSFTKDTVKIDVPIDCLLGVERGEVGFNVGFTNGKSYYINDAVHPGKVRLRIRPTSAPPTEEPPATETPAA